MRSIDHPIRGSKWGVFLITFFLYCSAIKSLYAQETVAVPNTHKNTHKLIRLNLGLAIANGGDKLVQTNFNDGTHGSISAGSGASLYAGIFFDIDQSNIDVLINIGMMDESDTSDEGHAELDRLFIDTLLLYKPHRHHRLGVGLSVHLQPELSVSNEVEQYNIEYKNALGYLFQYEYLFSSKGRGIPSIGIRYLDINYQTMKINNDINASHWALSLNYIF